MVLRIDCTHLIDHIIRFDIRLEQWFFCVCMQRKLAEWYSNLCLVFVLQTAYSTSFCGRCLEIGNLREFKKFDIQFHLSTNLYAQLLWPRPSR